MSVVWIRQMNRKWWMVLLCPGSDVVCSPQIPLYWWYWCCYDDPCHLNLSCLRCLDPTQDSSIVLFVNILQHVLSFSDGHNDMLPLMIHTYLSLWKMIHHFLYRKKDFQSVSSSSFPPIFPSSRLCNSDCRSDSYPFQPIYPIYVDISVWLCSLVRFVPVCE